MRGDLSTCPARYGQTLKESGSEGPAGSTSGPRPASALKVEYPGRQFSKGWLLQGSAAQHAISLMMPYVQQLPYVPNAHTAYCPWTLFSACVSTSMWKYYSVYSFLHKLDLICAKIENIRFGTYTLAKIKHILISASAMDYCSFNGSFDNTYLS